MLMRVEKRKVCSFKIDHGNSNVRGGELLAISASYRSEIVTSTNSGKERPCHRAATLGLKRFGQPPFA